MPPNVQTTTKVLAIAASPACQAFAANEDGKACFVAASVVTPQFGNVPAVQHVTCPQAGETSINIMQSAVGGH